MGKDHPYTHEVEVMGEGLLDLAWESEGLEEMER